MSKELERRVAQLEAMVEKLLAENALLRQENARLREQNTRLRDENTRLRDEVSRLKKNSRTSSKPPSSDITSASRSSKSDKPGRSRKKRSIGGQPGHDKHTRTPFAPERIDESFEYEWSDAGAPACRRWR
jgi:regulator of replication initiation timing